MHTNTEQLEETYEGVWDVAAMSHGQHGFYSFFGCSKLIDFVLLKKNHKTIDKRRTVVILSFLNTPSRQWKD